MLHLPGSVLSDELSNKLSLPFEVSDDHELATDSRQRAEHLFESVWPLTVVENSRACFVCACSELSDERSKLYSARQWEMQHLPGSELFNEQSSERSVLS